jgi:small-conductance mechanosensitive channel
MPFDFISDDPVVQRIVAGSVFGGLLVAAIIVRIATTLIARRLTHHGQHAIAPEVVRAFRNTGALFLFSLGISLGLATLPEAEGWRDEIATTWTIVAALLIAQGSSTAVRVVLAWYSKYVAPKTATNFDDRMLPLVRRILVMAVYGIALLVSLDALGVPISPFLGGLGITGLAVALALQPTLGNFFAGTYVLSDGAIQVGDYIELNGGPAGYVIDVGWRSTKIRTWMNNLVVIPNSVMADSIVINYSSPDAEMNVLITAGVSYDSDLDKVERVSLEVARQVIAEVPEAIKTMDAYFGFDSFGESNITFWVFMQSTDRFGSFIVTNELIKRLWARFAAEGIEINYPVRKLVFPAGAAPLATAT